jgi:hypothetical protein
MFLPLARVTITREDWVYGSRPFVAVNRDHIKSGIHAKKTIQ